MKPDSVLNKIASDKRSQFLIFFIVLIAMSAAMVYIYLPFCPGHDSYFHFGRLQSLMDAFGEGRFFIYPDYSVMEGYGYFTRAFYPDFILIPFAFIGNLTSLEFAYHFMIFTLTVLCGVFTYLMISRIYASRYAAAIGALLFTFAMYRILDIYHRGAIAEATSFTFVPLVFWGAYEIVKGDYRKWYILTIGFSLLVLTHALSSILLFITLLIVLAIYCKSLIKEPKRIKYLILSGLVTLPVVGYYFFPMIEQMLINTYYYDVNPLTSIKDNILGTYSVIWGMFYGVVYPGRGFTPGTGLVLTCAIILRLFVYEKSALLKSVDAGVIIGLVYIFASSYLFPWDIFPFNKLSLIQMPWRLYEFSSFFFAVAGGYYLSRILKSNTRRFLAGGMICSLLLLVIINDAKLYHDVRSTVGIVKEKSAGNNYHLIGIEYLPEKIPSVEYIAQRGDSIKASDGVHIYNYTKKDDVISLDMEANGSSTLELPLIYYKGYKAELNNAEIPVSESDNGLVQIAVNQSGQVKIYYGGTVLQKVSWFISLISALGLCVYIFLFIRKSKKAPM